MNPASLFAGPALAPSGIACRVVRAPDDVTDTIDVVWTAPADETTAEEDGRETSVRWWSQPLGFPQEGDYAMLMTDSNGSPVAFVWGSGTVGFMLDGDGNLYVSYG